MVWEESRRVFYSEFQSAVRQIDVNQLLRAVAEKSASQKQFMGFDSDWLQAAPWALSGIAREAILSSHRNGTKDLDNRRFVRLLNLFRQIDVTDHDDFKIYPFFTSVGHAQFPYQIHAKEELARPGLVLLETEIDKKSKTSSELAELFGCPAEDVAYATFLIYALAKGNRGMLHPDQIRELYRNRGARKLPPIASVFGTMTRLTATIQEAREDGLNVKQLKGSQQQFGYNPLSRTPFIKMQDGWLCAPQTYFVLRSSSMESIYYAGQRMWPNGEFSTELGHRVEAYIGNQLKHTGLLDVRPEFVTGKGTKSTDWIVVTPQAVILIESKSARIPIEVRAGVDEAAQLVTDRLTVAYEQLNRTAIGIAAGLDKYSHVPADRPIVGVVVTAEPIYMANDPEVRALLPETSIPIGVVALRDLERLATFKPEFLANTLLAWLSHPVASGYEVLSAMRDLGIDTPTSSNALIDAAYNRYLEVSKANSAGVA